MKKILKFISLALAIGFVSCDQDETTYNALNYPNDSFVFLTSNGISVPEAEKGIIDIVLSRATSKSGADSELEIPYILLSELKEGVDYKIIDNKKSFKLASGVFNDTLKVKLIDNFVEDGDKEIKINLIESEGVGFSENTYEGKSFTISINDDDCSLKSDLFEGTPSGTETSESSAGEKPAEVTFSVESSTETTVTYKIKGILAPQFSKWGEEINSGGEYLITIDNSDPINPKVIAINNGDPFNHSLNYFYAQTDNEWTYYLKLKNSSYSTCGKTIDLTFSIDIVKESTGDVYNDDFKTSLKLKF